MLAVIRQLEVNRCSTTTLIVVDLSTARVAGSGVLAGGSIGHAVDNVQFGILVSSNMEIGHGEATLVRATSEGGSRGTGAMAGARRATPGDSTGDTFLGLGPRSVCVNDR
jgi:hypothetical protein